MLDCLIAFANAVNDARISKNDPPKIVLPKQFTATEKKLARMFQERIPTCIVDSGCSMGYMYQRNRKRPIWDKPSSWCEFSISGGKLDILPYTNLFHYLSGTLDYEKEWDSQFQKWRYSLDNPENFEAYLEEFKHPEDGETFNWDMRGYTYNYDTSFSQDFVFYGNKEYPDLVIIQLHNGADARYGFTKPTLFSVKSMEEFYATPFQVSLYCSHCDAFWDMEEGSWLTEPAGGCDFRSEPYKSLEDYPVEEGEEGKQGIVVVTKDEHAFCPVCGKGLLE